MNSDFPWLSMILERVRPGLSDLCSELGVSRECSLVLESLVEAYPVWFEGKKKRTITATVLYVSLLLSNGPRKGVLRRALDAAGVSKVSLREATLRIVNVDWDLGFVYLNPRVYAALRKRTSLPGYVLPLTPRDVVRAVFSRISPGLYEALNVECKKSTGRDCITLLFENPALVRDVLVNRYREPVVAKRIAEKIFTSIVEVLHISESPRKLVELLYGNPDEVRRILTSVSVPIR